MPAPPAAGSLLFGMLALQTNFITRAQLTDAALAWTREPKTPLAQHLSNAGALTDDDKMLLAKLLNRHVRRHDNDPIKSLTALGIPADPYACLASMGDPELAAVLAHLPPP